MQQQEQINLKEKSVIELKAIAFDFQSVVQQYSQMLNTVAQEIQTRVAAEEQAKATDKVEEAEIV